MVTATSQQLESMLSNDLSLEEKDEFLEMFKDFPNLFATSYHDLRHVIAIEHQIDLKPDAKPVVQRYRRLGPVQTDALRLEITKLVDAGFIIPVHNTEWVSPVIVTPKKNGKWRICIDYKKLNAATKRDYHPLPFQDIILEKVSGHEDRKSTRLNSSHSGESRMPSSA